MIGLSDLTITKQNILEAFWKLYAQGGISNVSVTKICKLAGYNRSTFYAYFQDIYEVLDMLESLIITPESFEKDLLLPIMNSSDEKALLKELLYFFEQYTPYLPILLGEYGDPKFRQKLLTKLTPIVIKHIPKDIYSTPYITYIVEYQNTAILSTITKWYQNKKDIPQEELIDLLLKLTRYGTRNILFPPIQNDLS